MAFPLAIVAGAVAIAGTLYSAYSSSQASAKAASESRQAAKEAKDLAQYEATLFRARGTKLISQQRALYGKAGVQMWGSPLEVMADTAAELEADALAIEKGGTTKARQLLGQAKVQQSTASSLLTAGLVKAGGQTVSLLAQEYPQWFGG